MTRKNDALYLLRDGTYADPKDCSKDTDGVLRHKNGVAVALNGDGEPETIATSTESNAKAAAAGGAAAE